MLLVFKQVGYTQVSHMQAATVIELLWSAIVVEKQFWLLAE